MGLYHSVGIAYGIEIPTTTDLDDIDDALRDQPHTPDNVGWLVIGDLDQLLLVTRHVRVEENAVVRLTPDALATVNDMTAWNEALHAAAVRLGHAAHPQPGWLVIHNYR